MSVSPTRPKRSVTQWNTPHRILRGTMTWACRIAADGTLNSKGGFSGTRCIGADGGGFPSELRDPSHILAFFQSRMTNGAGYPRRGRHKQLKAWPPSSSAKRWLNPTALDFRIQRERTATSTQRQPSTHHTSSLILTNYGRLIIGYHLR